MFEKYLDLTDIGEFDKERDVKILTRCLAALSIYHETGCTEELAAKAVWDGGGDNGIDAAYYDPSEACAVFSQSKWIRKGSGEPEEKEIAVFIKGVRALIEQDADLFSAKVQVKLADIFTKLNTPGTRVKVVVISTGSSTLADPGRRTLEGFMEELNGADPDPIATSTILGLQEVYQALSSTNAAGGITLDASIQDWSYIATPFPAYFGIIDGLQLKGWWIRYGKRLVSMNIRHSLGATDVNSQIKQTANTEPEKFWYFNNGITLICEESTKAPALASSRSFGNFQFRSASIVNGAQTVSTLAKIENDAALANVRVQVRVIDLSGTPQDFGSQVTRTNNLQNRVEYRDFVAQDPEQKRLQEEMAMENVDYQYVRSEESVTSEKTCDLTEVTTALACAFSDPAYAVYVKTGISRLYQDLSKAPYKALFNSSVTGARAFNSVIVLRGVERWIEAKKKSLDKRSGARWGTLVHGNRILAATVFSRFEQDTLSVTIADFPSKLDRSTLDNYCELSYERMVEKLTCDFNGKFLAVLFKNPTASRQVYDYAKIDGMPAAPNDLLLT